MAWWVEWSALGVTGGLSRVFILSTVSIIRKLSVWNHHFSSQSRVCPLIMSVHVVVCCVGVLEIARTGRIALTRESGVDTKFLETMRSSTRIF